MAKVAVMCWQEIPSAVEVRDGEGTQKVQLSNRFMELIDMIAMRRDLAGADDYLMQWHKEKQADREGKAADIARAVADEIEGSYDQIRAQALASLKG
ncbi:MAG: virulence factor [Hyphomicrobiaceae bacterium]|nr:virulence factor [Hyphomicrobiaceae bacterium]